MAEARSRRGRSHADASTKLSQKEALNKAESDGLSPEAAWTTYGREVKPVADKDRFLRSYRARLKRRSAPEVQVRDPGTKRQRETAAAARAHAAAAAYAFTDSDTDSTEDGDVDEDDGMSAII